MTAYEDSYKAAIEKAVFNGRYTADSVIVTICLAVALYNSLEMVLLIATTFKRYAGLYFWSLSLSNLGVILYSIGMLVTYFDIGPRVFYKIILDIGWILMITCQSLVLYSRLGLVLKNERILSGVKWMIIIDSALLGIVVITFDFGHTFSSRLSFARGYFYIEHVQMTVFTIQEIIISSLYVWKTIKLLKVISGSKTRKMIWQLMVINVIIISMDIGIVVLQYLHLQLYQESIKGFVYSVKLKLELNILSKLIDFVDGGSRNQSIALEDVDATILSGTSQADIQREMTGNGQSNTWFGSDAKGPTNQIDDTPATGSTGSSSYSRRNTELDGFKRSISRPSRFASRTHGRDSDIDYADILRDLA